MICWTWIQMFSILSCVELQARERYTTSSTAFKHHQPNAKAPLTGFITVFLMFAVLLHILSRFLPSRLLTLPKISEHMEISINSPKTVKMDPDTGTSIIPVSRDQEMHGFITELQTLSSTASSPSTRPNMAESGIEIETPRSLTPESSVGAGDNSSHEKISTLSALWTEQSEKVRGQDASLIRSSCSPALQAITRPFEYVMALPGKNFRTQVLAAFNLWLQVDERSLSTIDRVVGMLHNASLM